MVVEGGGAREGRDEARDRGCGDDGSDAGGGWRGRRARDAFVVSPVVVVVVAEGRRGGESDRRHREARGRLTGRVEVVNRGGAVLRARGLGEDGEEDEGVRFRAFLPKSQMRSTRLRLASNGTSGNGTRGGVRQG